MIEIKEIESLEDLIAWRKEVIAHVFDVTPGRSLLEANCSYYIRHIADGTHIAYVALVDGEEAGCGSICLSEELPSPDNTSGKCAYLMNIYVREKFRNHGVAHAIIMKLLQRAFEIDCGKIYLETTDEGRPVYESIGFRDMDGMMKLDLKALKND